MKFKTMDGSKFYTETVFVEAIKLKIQKINFFFYSHHMSANNLISIKVIQRNIEERVNSSTFIDSNCFIFQRTF